MKKIAIVGAFSTGKTSLVNKIERQLGLLGYTDFERETLKNIQGQDDWKQMWLISEQIKQEYNIYDRYKNDKIFKGYITDTSLITILAYSYYILKPDEYLAYYNRVKEFLRNYPYTNIFYLPTEIEIEDDGYRHTDKQLQEKINSKIIEILIDLRLNFTILAGTLEDRYNLFIKNI